MLKLKLQYFGHLMRRTDSFEKTLMLGKIEGRRRKGWQRMRWLDGITNSMGLSLSWWWTGKPGMLRSMRLERVGHDWATELNWTRTFPLLSNLFSLRHTSFADARETELSHSKSDPLWAIYKRRTYWFIWFHSIFSSFEIWKHSLLHSIISIFYVCSHKCLDYNRKWQINMLL